MRSKYLALLLLVPILGGAMIATATQVDSTEHCVLTRYGEVKETKMATGLHFTPFSDATCFSLTDVNFPGSDTPEQIEAQTSDPVTLTSDLTVVYSYDPTSVFAVFQAKRSPEAAELEIKNAIRSGYRTALSGWSVSDVFSPQRAALDDSVRTHIQRKLGTLATIKQVFVRNLKVPPAIEQARIAAAKQEQVLDAARKQAMIDSVNANATLISARARAEAKRLEAQSYESNPQLLRLEEVKAMAEGLAKVCANAQTCIVGGSVMDTYTRGMPK